MKSNDGGIRGLFTLKNIKNFIYLNFGILLSALGIYFFKFPNNFSYGGVSGFSIVLGRLFQGTTPAELMAVINISLLVVGFIFLGKSFGFWTSYCSIMLSLETWIFEKFLPMETPFTDEPILELCFAVMLPAVGSALMFNLNASSGGTDVIAMILKKYTSLDIGKALLVTDSLIVVSAFFVFDIKTGLFSMVGLFLKAFLVDSVIEMINMCKFFSIVTTKPDEVGNYIIKELGHTSTILEAEGGYSRENRHVILTACKRWEAIRLRQKIKEIDKSSFMFVTNTSEIIGKGFRDI